MTEIYGVYSAECDKTFIIEDTYDEDGDIVSSEVIGWYFGEPNDSNNKVYGNRMYKATFK